ncbi:MAG: DUF1761 domain-containing protein [Bacteriovoracales bacterium]
MNQVNIFAVITATLFSFFLGFIWYSILFNKQFFKYMEVKSTGEKPSKEMMIKSFSTFLFFALFTSFVFGLGLDLWRKSQTEPHWCQSLTYSFIIWLGFFLPFHTGKVSWEMKKWGVVVLNGSYELVRALGMGLIFWFWP